MTHGPSPAPSRATRRRPRGFTLVELIIAMAAGLVVSMAAILLAKGATRFFQNEARISATHMAAMLGLSRLTADLQRASFHSSPNVIKDRLNAGLCGDPTPWPAGMRRLAGVAIARQGSVIDHGGELDQSIANGLRPDAIVIGGSLHTVEEFRFNSVEGCGLGGCVVNLQGDSSAMKRTRARNAIGGEDIEDIFRQGRLLRLRIDGQTKYMYGVIKALQTVGAPPNETYSVLLEEIPTLPASDGDCGVSVLGPNGSGGFANPVARVRYDIRSLRSHLTYGPLVEPINPSVTGDDGRTELVRVELDAENNEMADTLELIAEYAVDLKFGLSAATEGGLPGIRNPQIARYPITAPIDSSDVYNIAGDITDLGSRPERIRSMQVRLSTRTRAPDRAADLDRRADGRKLRFLLPGIVSTVNTDTDPIPPGAPDIFARMRTFYADVALPNQAGVEW